MSRRSPSVAGRIEEIRKATPPPKGRKSRLGFISKDDFADLLGAGRSTVLNWTSGKSYPEARYRVKLAQLSQGRYQPDDFARPGSAAEETGALARRVAGLERAVALIEQRLSGEADPPEL